MFKILNKTDVSNAIKSYVGSERYLKKIVPLTIINIVHYRTNQDPNKFQKVTINELNLYRLKDKLDKDDDLVQLMYSAKHCMEALEKKFVRNSNSFDFE